MTIEKIATVGIKKEEGFLYFVDTDGDISRHFMKRGGTKQPKNYKQELKHLITKKEKIIKKIDNKLISLQRQSECIEFFQQNLVTVETQIVELLKANKFEELPKSVVDTTKVAPPVQISVEK